MSCRVVVTLSLLLGAACGGDDDGGGGGHVDAAADIDASEEAEIDAGGEPDAGCTAELHVAPDGDDDTGDGSEGAPLRTIAQGVALANDDACTSVAIHVAAGTYDEASGEAQIDIVRAGISIIGAGAATTTLTGSFEPYVIQLDQDVTIEGITVVNEGGAGTIAARFSGPARATGVDFTAPGGTAVRVYEQGAVIDGSSHLRDSAAGGRIETGGQLLLSDSMVVDNASIGLDFEDVAADNTTSRLDGAFISDNGSHGMQVAGNSRVVVRDSTIVGNDGSGIRAVGASVQLDLGTVDDAGGNTFNVSANRNGGVGLCNLTGLTLNADGNTWAECPPSTDAGCASGDDLNTGVTAANCSAQ